MPDVPTDAGARLATDLEITKLSYELDLAPDELAFLRDQPADALRALREDITAALFARHERRFARVAALSNMVPASVAARAAQLAIGPVVSARIAAAMPPDEAVKLAAKLPADFLAELTLSLDPVRASAIVRRLPSELVVEVGRLLLARGEHLVLGRFVSIVEPDIAAALVGDATPNTLLEIALLSDDRSVLTPLVAALPDADLAAILTHCHSAGAQVDALTLLTSLDHPTRARVISVLAREDVAVSDGFLTAVGDLGAWTAVLPALDHLDDDPLRRLVNSESTASPETFDAVVRAAHAGDHGPLLVRILLLLDDEHVEVLHTTRQLREPETRAWVVEHAGVARPLSEALLRGLGLETS